MLTKYNRKQIKANKRLRRMQFVLAIDAENAMVQLIEAAIKAGADKDELIKMM
tara:strand:- start:1300 stop:1458 length:159 start_codon:yes stop_codon:yes gene_type:complete